MLCNASGDNFAELLSKHRYVVADFYADWCGPCKQLAPKFAEFAEKYSDVLFVKVNVDQEEDLATQYNIECMPTVLFFENGKQTDTQTGGCQDAIDKCCQKWCKEKTH